MLPRFLLADNSQDSVDIVYVIHTQHPRCIIRCDLDGFFSRQEIFWLDEQPMAPDTVAAILEAAEDFFEKELDNQEDLYDDENDDDDTGEE